MRFIYKDTEFSGTVINIQDGTVNVKLKSGYNISVPDESLQIIEVSERKSARKEETVASRTAGSNRVGILATGGTIASRVDYITGAVKPVLNPEFLKETISNISDFSTDIDLMEARLSENLTPADWIDFGRRAKKLVDSNGSCLILHGTDTMSYSAAALSFMFKHLSGPVIFLGSQRSSDRPSSDAFLNMEAALEFSKMRFGEVAIAMHHGLSDDVVDLHRGVRTRKMHTSRRDAFKSIGIEPIASYSEKSVKVNWSPRLPDDHTDLVDRLDSRVSLIYFHPALSSQDLGTLLSGKKAVVLMGTGLGHVPDRYHDVLKDSIKGGTKVIMTSQCLNGRVDMNVYSTGRNLLSVGVISGDTILPEVAMIKSMFLLGNFPEDQFEELFRTDMRGEFLQREANLADVS